MTKKEEIIKIINDAANIIANKSRQSSANYIIVSPKIAKELNNLDSKIKLRKLRKKKLEEIYKNKNL
jgi:hypothetical protein